MTSSSGRMRFASKTSRAFASCGWAGVEQPRRRRRGTHLVIVVVDDRKAPLRFQLLEVQLARTEERVKRLLLRLAGHQVLEVGVEEVLAAFNNRRYARFIKGQEKKLEALKNGDD